jgi:hypothetical protein
VQKINGLFFILGPLGADTAAMGLNNFEWQQDIVNTGSPRQQVTGLECHTD